MELSKSDLMYLVGSLDRNIERTKRILVEWPSAATQERKQFQKEIEEMNELRTRLRNQWDEMA